MRGNPEFDSHFTRIVFNTNLSKYPNNYKFRYIAATSEITFAMKRHPNRESVVGRKLLNVRNQLIAVDTGNEQTCSITNCNFLKSREEEKNGRAQQHNKPASSNEVIRGFQGLLPSLM